MTLNNKYVETIENNKIWMDLHIWWNLEEALLKFDEVLEKEPEYEYTMINKWFTLTAMWKYEDAIEIFQTVIKISDVIKSWEKTDLYFNLAYIYFIIQDYNNAIVYFEKDLGFNLNNLETLEYLGESYMNIWNYEDAIEYFNKILLFEPSNIIVLNNLWVCLLELNKYNDSLIYFNKVLDIDSEYIQSIYNKWLALELLKDKSNSLICFQKIVEIDPLNESAIFKISKLNKSLKKIKNKKIKNNK